MSKIKTEHYSRMNFKRKLSTMIKYKFRSEAQKTKNMKKKNESENASSVHLLEMAGE